MALSLKKIVWAVDILPGGDQLETHALKNLQQLVRNMNCEIQPVFVANDMLAGPEFADIHKKLTQRLAVFGLSNLNSPEVIGQELSIFARTRDVVSKFLNYAYENKADLVAVHTHAKQGLDRLFLGSFAETLLLNCKTPILSLNPKTPVVNQFNNVFVPTDFSSQSAKAFRTALQLAKNWGATIHLYHKTRLLHPHYLGPYGVLAEDLREDHEIETKKSREKLESLCKEADGNGVKCEPLLDTDLEEVRDAIVNKARETDSDLIFMATAADDSAMFSMLGSTARQVIRHAYCPVWVDK